VTAVIDTLLDLRRTIIELALDFGGLPTGVRFGGLRGGTAQVGKGGVQLHRLSYVPGVELTGVIPGELLLRNTGPTASLGVGGPEAASGRLRIAAGGRVSGVLSGHRLHADVAARVRVARAARGAWPDAPASFPLPGLARLR
jgi:hypothetical protein